MYLIRILVYTILFAIVHLTNYCALDRRMNGTSSSRQAWTCRISQLQISPMVIAHLLELLCRKTRSLHRDKDVRVLTCEAVARKSANG
jgi:hypothetical protein